MSDRLMPPATLSVPVGEIFEPELERIHSELVGKVVHGRFGHRAALAGWFGARKAQRTTAVDEYVRVRCADTFGTL